MISDRDIYRTANIMIREYGSEAHLQAAMRADELLDKGDLDGQRAWLRIIKAIEELRSTERGDAPLSEQQMSAFGWKADMPVDIEDVR